MKNKKKSISKCQVSLVAQPLSDKVTRIFQNVINLGFFSHHKTGEVIDSIHRFSLASSITIFTRESQRVKVRGKKCIAILFLFCLCTIFLIFLPLCTYFQIWKLEFFPLLQKHAMMYTHLKLNFASYVSIISSMYKLVFGVEKIALSFSNKTAHFSTNNISRYLSYNVP